MLEIEVSSWPFFIIFNSILLVIGYNFWNLFPRNGAKYSNSNYYHNIKIREKDMSRVEETLILPAASKLISSCVQTGMDSRSG